METLFVLISMMLQKRRNPVIIPHQNAMVFKNDQILKLNLTHSSPSGVVVLILILKPLIRAVVVIVVLIG